MEKLFQILAQRNISFQFELNEATGNISFEKQEFSLKTNEAKQIGIKLWQSYFLPLASKIEKQIEIYSNELSFQQVIEFLKEQKNDKNISIKIQNNEIVISDTQIYYQLDKTDEDNLLYLLSKINQQESINLKFYLLNKVNGKYSIFNEIQSMNLSYIRSFNFTFYLKTYRFEGLSLFNKLCQQPNIKNINMQVDCNIFKLESGNLQQNIDQNQMIFEENLQQTIKGGKLQICLPSVLLAKEEYKEYSSIEINSITTNVNSKNKIETTQNYKQILELLKNRISPYLSTQVSINNYQFQRSEGMIKINNVDQMDILENFNYQMVQSLEINNINLKESILQWNKMIQEVLQQSQNTLKQITLNFGMNMKKYNVNFIQLLNLPFIKSITLLYQGEQGVILDISKGILELKNYGIDYLKLATGACDIKQLSLIIDHKQVLSSEEVDLIKQMQLNSLVIERLSAPHQEKFDEVQKLQIEHCFEKVASVNIKFSNNLILFDRIAKETRIETDSNSILELLPSFSFTQTLKLKYKTFLNQKSFDDITKLIHSPTSLKECNKIFLNLHTSIEQFIQLIEVLDSVNNIKFDVVISQFDSVFDNENVIAIGKSLNQSKNIIQYQMFAPVEHRIKVLEIKGDKQRIFMNTTYMDILLNLDLNFNYRYLIIPFISQFQKCTTLKVPFLKQFDYFNIPILQKEMEKFKEISIELSQNLPLLKRVQLFSDRNYFNKIYTNQMARYFYIHLLQRKQAIYLIKSLQKHAYLNLSRPEKLIQLIECYSIIPDLSQNRIIS